VGYGYGVQYLIVAVVSIVAFGLFRLLMWAGVEFSLGLLIGGMVVAASYWIRTGRDLID
jgi:hypothetical protein